MPGSQHSIEQRCGHLLGGYAPCKAGHHAPNLGRVQLVHAVVSVHSILHVDLHTEAMHSMCAPCARVHTVSNNFNTITSVLSRRSLPFPASSRAGSLRQSVHSLTEARESQSHLASLGAPKLLGAQEGGAAAEAQARAHRVREAGLVVRVPDGHPGHPHVRCLPWRLGVRASRRLRTCGAAMPGSQHHAITLTPGSACTVDADTTLRALLGLLRNSSR